MINSNETVRVDKITGAEFTSNYISTTKYTKFNFLPFCLFDQFKKMSNIYFLTIAVLQSIPAISPLKGYTAVLPLFLVVVASMLREGVEDLVRYKSDQATNN